MIKSKTPWKAGWRTIGETNKYYRSGWEANYAYYLQWLKENKQIQSWAHEPKTFWFEGIKQGTTNYTPDFKVTLKDGTTEYHEVKGWMDARSKLKIRRMKKYHPSIVLVVRDSAWFKEHRSFKNQIPGWI